MDSMLINKESSIYIALSGASLAFNENERERAFKAIKSVFGTNVKKVSEVEESDIIEVVYQLQIPVLHDNSMLDEFFEDLEVILHEFEEYNAHFTQFKRGDINALNTN